MHVLNPLLPPFLILHPTFFSLSFVFLVFVLFSPILFVHISFLLFHIHMFFLYLPVLHMVVASFFWIVLPWSDTEPPHFTPPSHLPSHCIKPLGWHHTNWQPITAHTLPYINHISMCVLLLTWPLQMGQIGCPKTSGGNYHHKLCMIAEQHRSNAKILINFKIW